MSLARRARAAAWGSFLFFRKKEEVRLKACKSAIKIADVNRAESSGVSTGGTVEDIIEEWHHERTHTNLADAIRVCQTGTRGPRWRRPARGPLGEGHDGLQQTSSDLQEGRGKIIVVSGRAALRCKTGLTSGRGKRDEVTLMKLRKH